MNTGVLEARIYVMNLVGLSNEEQIHLKQLLNRGVIIPPAVLGSTAEDLREIIALNPLLPIKGTFLLMIDEFY
jgi:hypothetical protein